MTKMVSQPLATPELLNDSVCSGEELCSKNCVSVKMNDPVLWLNLRFSLSLTICES